MGPDTWAGPRSWTACPDELKTSLNVLGTKGLEIPPNRGGMDYEE